MADRKANNLAHIVAGVVNRSCGGSFVLESLCITEVKDLLSTYLPLKSSAAG